jgi:hypothetical protein
MPSSDRPRLSTLDCPTRQQLDELDALMQRMLALPVNAVEDSPTSADQSVRNETAAENRSTSSDPPSSPSPSPESPSPLPAHSIAAEDHKAEAGVNETRPSTEVSESPEEDVLGFTPSPVHPKKYAVVHTESDRFFSARSQVSLAKPHPRSVPEGPLPMPRLAWPLRPLLWINRAFDGSTAWLGPLGRWQREPTGLALLGWTGFLLLVAALAWVAVDTLGWTW